MQACHLSAKPSAVGEALVRMTHALWPAVAASAALTGPTPAAVAYGPGAPTAAHLKQWEKKGSRSYAAVLQQALLMGLQHISAEVLQALPGRLVWSPSDAIQANLQSRLNMAASCLSLHCLLTCCMSSSVSGMTWH